MSATGRRNGLADTDHERLDEIVDELNGRPRETLEWMTPAEKFTEFVATTT